MKILIVMDQLPPHLTATSGIMYELGEWLSTNYGIDVSFLGNCRGDAKSPFRMWGSTELFRYSELVPSELSKWKKTIKIAAHPSVWGTRMALSSHPRYPLQKIYKRLLKQALKEEPNFDCIICATNPWDTVVAAADIVGSIPLVVYKADPWGTNSYCIGDRNYWEDEQRIDERCSAIFVPTPVYQDYVSGINLAPLEKVHKVEFPNIKKPVWNEELKPSFADGKIHCAFVGQLYSNIRKPDFMFELFENLKEKNVVLHIVGNTETQAQEYRDKLPSNIILHGMVSPEEASMYMQASNILVNLGNTVANQLPSKLISYMACGKPIINICKISNCLSIPYMEKYPLSFTMMESDALTPEFIKQVEEFCFENSKKTLSFSNVKETFYECTPEYVGKMVYDALCDITKKN